MRLPAGPRLILPAMSMVPVPARVTPPAPVQMRLPVIVVVPEPEIDRVPLLALVIVPLMVSFWVGSPRLMVGSPPPESAVMVIGTASEMILMVSVFIGGVQGHGRHMGGRDGHRGGTGPGDESRSRAGHGNGHRGVRQRVDARRELDAEPVRNARRNGKSQVAAVTEGQSGGSEHAHGGVGGSAETGNVFRHDLVTVGVAQGDIGIRESLGRGGESLVSGRSA